jgi:hypothetical protein
LRDAQPSPYDINQIADRLKCAVDMSATERATPKRRKVSATARLSGQTEDATRTKHQLLYDFEVRRRTTGQGVNFEPGSPPSMLTQINTRLIQKPDPFVVRQSFKERGITF